MRTASFIRTAGGAAAVTAHQPGHPTRVGWHSPIPYLFGGLAAMLALIAFALLILACSYWKLSGYLDSGSNGEDLENGEAKLRDPGKTSPLAMERRIVVIMAGEEKPTFIATPISARTSPIESNSKSHGGGEELADEKKELAQNQGD